MKQEIANSAAFKPQYPAPNLKAIPDARTLKPLTKAVLAFGVEDTHAGCRSCRVNNREPSAWVHLRVQFGSNKCFVGFFSALFALCLVLLSYSNCVKTRIGVGEVASSNLVVPTILQICPFDDLLRLYFFVLPIPCSFRTSCLTPVGTEFAGHSNAYYLERKTMPAPSRRLFCTFEPELGSCVRNQLASITRSAR